MSSRSSATSKDDLGSAPYGRGSDMTRLRFKPGTIEPASRDKWAGIYSDALNYLRDTNEVSAADKEKMFSGTIRRLLDWT